MISLDQVEGKGFEFPCEYPVKAMGPNTPEFKQKITDIVKQHAPEVSSNSVHCKTSSTGKYQSVTVLVYAQSKEHLISIYQDINTIKEVMWTL
ncbi:MAG: YbeD family protein [Marinicella sp.]